MATNPMDDPWGSDEVLAQAERRWAALARSRPDLSPAIEVQRRLITRGLGLGVAIDASPPLAVAMPPSDVAARVGMKRPAFSGVRFDVDGAALAPIVIAFCDDLATGGAGPPAERLRQTLERRVIDVGSLLSASLMRQLHAVRTTANHVGVAPDLLWLVGELGAAPLAHRLQRRHLTEAASSHPALKTALDAWDGGSCPACGSWPAFAERIGDRRHLRCSFCGTGWQPERCRCIYCDAGGDSFLTAASDDGVCGARLELCRLCGGYLKSLPADRHTPFELMPVEDLVSSDLDLSAVERGYTRPSMREIEAV